MTIVIEGSTNDLLNGLCTKTWSLFELHLLHNVVALFAMIMIIIIIMQPQENGLSSEYLCVFMNVTIIIDRIGDSVQAVSSWSEPAPRGCVDASLALQVALQ